MNNFFWGGEGGGGEVKKIYLDKKSMILISPRNLSLLKIILDKIRTSQDFSDNYWKFEILFGLSDDLWGFSGLDWHLDT